MSKSNIKKRILKDFNNATEIDEVNVNNMLVPDEKNMTNYGKF